MARGWESKAVEDQQLESERDRSGLRREAGALDHRRTLELSRSRVAAQLGQARTEAQRQALTRALADLDAQLRDASGAG